MICAGCCLLMSLASGTNDPTFVLGWLLQFQALREAKLYVYISLKQLLETHDKSELGRRIRKASFVNAYRSRFSSLPHDKIFLS